MGGLDLSPALLFISSHLRCFYVCRLAVPAGSFWQQEVHLTYLVQSQV